MKLYNSKTNRIEKFVPVNPGQVDMYVCGPTVYNHAHIGNARPLIVFDTLRRLFMLQGYTVKFVSNYTDVDDKIINKASAQHQPEHTVSEYYIKAYQEVRKSLNVMEPDVTPRVTQTMDAIIAFIKDLLDHGFAYTVDGDVYFRVDRIHDYGKLSGQNIADLLVGARIEENSKKENPLDFALWKTTDLGIKWPTPWGEGRPGWHTECVVMIGKEFHKHLIDIHGGGMDLKFPHHENEMAQAEACYGTELANYWLHNGMLNIDGEKMSKSLGNVVWAKDFVARLGANVTRWLMLSTHYRLPLNISEDTIATAQTEVSRVLTALRQADIRAQLDGIATTDNIDKAMLDRFIKAMNEDINTPNGFMEIFEAVKALNKALRQRAIDWDEVMRMRNVLLKMLEVMGIVYDRPQLSEEDRTLFADWETARQAKNFAKADEYRQKLMEKGLV